MASYTVKRKYIGLISLWSSATYDGIHFCFWTCCFIHLRKYLSHYFQSPSSSLQGRTYMEFHHWLK